MKATVFRCSSLVAIVVCLCQHLGVANMFGNEAPRVAVASPPLNAQVNSLGLIEVYFNEAVTNVDAADLLLNGVPATNIVSYAPNDYLFYFAQPAQGTVQVSFAANHGIVDRDAAPQPFAGTNWTYTFDTNVPANVWISEFLAGNSANIEDEDGDNSDWVEIYNAGPGTVDLAGWHLTDDPSLPGKWTFPRLMNMSLGPNQYLLVWASGKNRTNVVTRLHTNFRLDRAGEYLGLLSPGLEVVSEFAPYPQQFTDASYGRDRTEPSLVGYYTVPTPRQQNGTSGSGFSAAAVFSVASGVFAVDSITVAISANSNAVIRYTLDGNEPTNGSPVYGSAFVFNSNIVVKARAFEPGLWPSPIVARTYHFLDPSAQNFSSELPIVIVSTAGRTIPQDIIGGGNRLRGSLVVIDTFRGRSAIQQTPQFIGLAQFEGYGSTSAGFPKRPYRVEVNDELGNDMDVSLLGLPPEADFKLEVKMNDKTLINEFVAFELHEQMGYYAPRTKFVEVFLDTGGGKITYPQDYAGIYMFTEVIERDKFRVNLAELTPEDTTEPEVSGGYIFKKDKDSQGDLNFAIPGGMGHAAQGLKVHEPKPRFITPQQFSYLTNYLYHFSASLYASNWLELTGTNHYSNYIDVDSFVDQHWIVEYTKNIDGYRLSHFWSKDRGGKIRDFPLWDFDLVFGNANYLECGRTNGWYWNLQQEGMSSAEHVWLRRLLYGVYNVVGNGGANALPTAVMNSGDPVFIQKMIDRWGELRTNIFGTERVLGRVNELVALLNEAAARNYQKYPILTQFQWPNPDGTGVWNVNFANQPTYAAIIGEMKRWITGRFNWLDAQFIHAPLLNHPGGFISGPVPVTIAGPAGAMLYYTTDGTDPRAPNGTLAVGAQVYSAAFTVEDNARVFARARVGTNQYSWSPAAAATLIRHTPPLRITEIMYHPAQDGLEYLVVENISNQPLNLAAFQLSVAVDFTFPSITLQGGGRAFVVENQAAFVARYGPENLIAGEFSGKLDNAGERLVLTGPLREPILDFSYDDAWYPITDGLGFSLVINEDSAPTTTWGDPASWHPNADAGIPRVVINEVIRAVRGGEVGGIELRNLASEPADISGWYLTDDLGRLSRQILPDTVIPAGGYLILSQYDFGADFVGDELFLLSANPDGTLTGYLSQARIGVQPPKITTGRYINSVGQEHFVPQRAQTFGAVNAGPAIPDVVISEIMYRPPDVFANGAYWDDTEDEFVELHNRSGTPVNLAGYVLEGAGVNYQFSSIVIQPGAYLLVVSFDPASNAQQLAAFLAKYGVSPSVQIVGPYAGSLANGGGALDLSVPVHYDTGDFQALLERVDYDRNAPWTSLPDGAGLSLQRVLLNEYANDPVNWRAATPSPGRASGSGAAPTITAQPQNRTVVASSTATATFSIGVGESNVRYQWRKDAKTISGATNSSLTVPATSTSDAGNYDVIVSNASGFTVSSNAALTVLIGITIVQQPQDLSVHVPANARFTILASSPSSIAYQWRFNGNAVPQVNGPELFLANPGESEEGVYDVVMTDSVGTVISTPARLTILAPPAMVAPVPPVNLVAVAGDRLTVSARLSGTLPIAARWRWTRGDGTSFTIGDQIINERVGVFSLVVPNDTVGRVRLSVTNAIGGSLGFAATNAIVTVLADSDGDHIPDIYERAHGMNEHDPADAAADPDGDGMSNRDEYIAGTDPQDRNSYLKVELQGANLATIHFQAVSNRSYTVQYTDSLNAPAWQHLEHVVARQTNYVATVTDPASVPKRFYRLATPATP